MSNNDEVEILQRYGLEDCQADAQIVQLIPLLRDIEKNQRFMDELNEEMAVLDSAMADAAITGGLAAIGALGLVGGPIGWLMAGAAILGANAEYDKAEREQKRKMAAARKSRKEIASQKIENVKYLHTRLVELSDKFMLWCDKSAMSEGQIGTPESKRREEVFKKKLIAFAGFIYSARLTDYYAHKFEMWIKVKEDEYEVPYPADAMYDCMSRYVDKDSVLKLIRERSLVWPVAARLALYDPFVLRYTIGYDIESGEEGYLSSDLKVCGLYPKEEVQNAFASNEYYKLMCELEASKPTNYGMGLAIAIAVIGILMALGGEIIYGGVTAIYGLRLCKSLSSINETIKALYKAKIEAAQSYLTMNMENKIYDGGVSDEIQELTDEAPNGSIWGAVIVSAGLFIGAVMLFKSDHFFYGLLCGAIWFLSGVGSLFMSSETDEWKRKVADYFGEE